VCPFIFVFRQSTGLSASSDAGFPNRRLKALNLHGATLQA
jgi:hypothetical protein